MVSTGNLFDAIGARPSRAQQCGIIERFRQIPRWTHDTTAARVASGVLEALGFRALLCPPSLTATAWQAGHAFFHFVTVCAILPSGCQCGA